MSKANRKRSNWGEFQSLQKPATDTVRMGAGRAYTTSTKAADKLPLYNPTTDLCAPAARPGADDALAIPSRINNRLNYRDGRAVEMDVVN